MWPSYTVIALYLKSGVERERGRRKVGSVPKQSVLALYVVREGGEMRFSGFGRKIVSKRAAIYLMSYGVFVQINVVRLLALVW